MLQLICIESLFDQSSMHCYSFLSIIPLMTEKKLDLNIVK